MISKIHFKNKKRLIYILLGVLLICFLFFNILQSVPQYNRLNREEQKLLYNITYEITENKETDLEKIESILVFIKNNINFSAPEGYNEDFSYNHGITDIFERKWGLCYDFSYLFELMAQSVGYETRHIALLNLNPRDTHAVSEVKIGSEWVFFDSSWARYYTNKDGEPLSIQEIMKSDSEELVKISLAEDSNINLPENYDYLVYGVFNFHGKLFRPKINYPDLIFSQLHHNLFNKKLPSII